MTATLPSQDQAASEAPTTVRTLTLAGAINAGLRAAMDRDPKVVLMGEDIGALGGVFRVTDGLHKDFGERRVIDTPLAESGIVGTAIGMSMRGYRPVVEIQFDGFIFPAYDQITTSLAKLHYRSQGRVSVPVVIRVPYAGGIGAIEHHSESPEALFAHTPGLRIITPATPQDGFDMIQQAIASPDPVMFFEPKARYWDKGEVDTARVAGQLGADAGASAGTAEMSSARIASPGTDVTLLAYGPTVRLALQAAAVAAKDGISVEVIDLRSISPIDFDTVIASVKRTGRAVVVHEAPVAFGTGAEIAARINELAFFRLEAPVLRVGGFHTPYPGSTHEHDYLPSLDRVLDAVDAVMAH
ncbi:alpha-ketoacid dehydrogenase subunit beta [Demequina sp. TTPB684]|uniref:alpha-ketoacid dehydrogenase subunit beta n=1 Tax=unclassified Demequina TaxID=2620311 RepID=UPI001CF32799|nr:MULTISPECIES: alpha-ketoacid dehydrogenase subunit beta [unclassified Demequina]MCB2413437.1 alpha-ketoacid dehydrogenase subunit beta [Demequina sp. TTPB684]UPU88000.1 alpha-ketoacid dehydrogenase subunit beta [Demequina sp. TMPB413]